MRPSARIFLAVVVGAVLLLGAVPAHSDCQYTCNYLGHFTTYDQAVAAVNGAIT